MKKLIAATIAIVGTTALHAQSVYVRPTVRSDGTVVQGHWRTAPNSSRADNWSSRPNVNPMTGKAGRVDPYAPRSIYRPLTTTSYPNPYRRGN